MRQTIRFKTFETNSSSYHTLTLNNHSEIVDTLNDAINILGSLDTTEEVYEVIAKIDVAKELLVRNLVDGGLRQIEDY